MLHHHNRTSRPLLALLAMLAFLAGTVPPVQADPADTISIIKDGEEGLSTGEIASRLTDATFTQADRVLIGRDDEFADAMTSGLLQSDSPLLLVPSAGPVPARIMDQIELLDPDEVLLLGGVDAISVDVQTELAAAGYAVARTFGPSRIETATEIAQVGASQADTVLIARAFADPDAGDPTQAFADAMAAGGWSASTGWPILLTQTDVLTGSTRDYLASGAITNAFVLGGTAAVSAAVEAELRNLVGNVERVAGSDRFGTAVAVADKLGAPSAADISRLLLVDGQNATSWAGGFAAAAHAAAFNAPIVLSTGDVIPPATQAWLTGNVPGEDTVDDRARGLAQDTSTDTDPIRLTCVTIASVCDEARSLLELPPRVQLRFDPPSGVTLTQGDSVQILTDGPVDALQVAGSCIDDAGSTSSPAEVAITALGQCELIVTPVLPGGIAQDSQTAMYTTLAPPPRAVLFQADDNETDGTEGQLYLVGVDGSDPRPVSSCNGCRGLRVSADGSTAVHVQDDALILRDGPDFDTPTPLVPAVTGVFWDDPQFTPDGQTVIATQLIDGDGPSVIGIDVATGDQTLLASGWRLAGSDAVGQADGVISGVGALVFQIQQIPDSIIQSQLGVIDTSLEDGDPEALETVPGLLRSASLSPDGAAYALDRGADRQVAVGFFTGRLTAATDIEDDLDIGQLVWADDITVQGLDFDPEPLTMVGFANYAQVDVTVGPVGVTSEVGPRSPQLLDVGRPGQLEGSLVAQVADALALADSGEPITALTNVTIANPHVLPAP